MTHQPIRKTDDFIEKHERFYKEFDCLVCFVGFLAVLFAQKPKKTRTKVALQPYLEDVICFARAKKFQTFLDGAILLIDEGKLIDSVVAG